MKTNHSTKHFGRFSFLLLGFLLTATSPLFARVLPTGFGLKTGLSGNGLRSAPTVTINFTGYKWELELGADFQLRNTNFSGAQATVYYYPMRTNIQRLRLGFFANCRYNFETLLGNATIAQENYLQPESRLNMKEVTLQTAELNAGFLLRVYHSQYISTFYGIGAGAYQTLGKPEDYPLKHREFNRAQLVLTAGIAIDLRRKY